MSLSDPPRTRPDTPASASPTWRTLFGSRTFTVLWAGQAVSNVGDALTRVALPVYAYVVTGQPFALATTFAAAQLPWLLASLLAGSLADRFAARTLIRLTLLAEGAAVAAVTLTHHAWQIAALALLTGSLQTVRAPARSAVLPSIVGASLMTKATALYTTTIQTTDVIGQAGGGLLIGAVGPRYALLADAVSFAVFAVLVPRLPARESDTTRSASPWRGFWLVATLPALRTTVLLMVVRGATVTASIPLLYLLVRGSMHAGPSGYGVLVGCLSAGLVAGSVLIGHAERITPRVSLIIFTALAGVLAVGLAAAGRLLLAVPVVMLLGLLYAPGNVTANAEFVVLAPAEARGRVVSAAWALIKSAQVLGALVQGALIAGIGAGRTLAVSGAVLVLACVALAAVRPRLGVPAPVPAVASRLSD